MNINTEEAKVFKTWLLDMATIVKRLNKLTIYKSKQSLIDMDVVNMFPDRQNTNGCVYIVKKTKLKSLYIK